MIIGQPKSISDLPPFNDEEIAAMSQPLNAMIAQGAPAELQAAVDFGSLCRLVATCTVLSAKVKTLEAPLPTLRPALVEE